MRQRGLYPYPKMNKTERKRGELIGRVREFLKTHDRISVADLPHMTKKQAANLLQFMWTGGELVRVQAAGSGRYCQPTIYGRADVYIEQECKPNARASHIDAGLEYLHSTAIPGRVYALHEIGEACGVSGEAIRQIEAQALRKLRQKISREEFCDAVQMLSRFRNDDGEEHRAPFISGPVKQMSV